MIFDEKSELSLNEPVDWVYLSELARKQNLLPLFFEVANRCEDYVKSDGYAKDQLDTFAMVAAQIQRSSAFLDIYEKITAQGVYPIVMKGIVCRQLYGELGEHRPSGDEDILVEVKDFPKVKEILEQEHYVCSVPD
ncbi:MAG: nucleotidyltransferase family protein, partial [Lachnospiraceae bacterium]|nr:nucleotidyltransferase family protein [Lachnospiraceae bacterium]